jgi:hypothetical protein
MSPKKYYSFMIDPEMVDALKLVKKRDGVSESEQIRRGIEMWLKSKGLTLKKKAERKRAGTRKRS